MINLIVAISANYGIGKDNDLIISNKEDMKFFKSMTTGTTVIMGRKTWESMNSKPLPNRFNIIITSTPLKYDEQASKQQIFVSSLEEAIKINKELFHLNEVFIIGGGQLYKEALEKDLVDVIYCNKYFATVPADTYFEKLDTDKWEKTSEKVSNDELFKYMKFNKIVSDKIQTEEEAKLRQIHMLSDYTLRLLSIQSNLTYQDFVDIGIYNAEHKFKIYAKNNYNLLHLLHNGLNGKDQKLMLEYINSKLN